MLDSAKNVVKTLHDAGFIAYFAGGCVRDFLLGIDSQDIDVATNATPDEVRSLFPKTIPVGANFGVIIVMIGDIQIEVTSFRKDGLYIDGRHPLYVERASPQEDAERRDFTINGMFLNPFNGEIIDFVGGKEDLKQGIIRAIGNPHERFQEDRLRMIRAVRFVAKFQFIIDKETQQAIQKLSSSLFPAVSQERILQELKKMADTPHFSKALLQLNDLHLLTEIFPEMKPWKEEKRLNAIHKLDSLDETVPLIAKLSILFESLPIEDLLPLCQRLKMSTHERQLLEFFKSAQNLFEREEQNLPIEDIEWAKHYAHLQSMMALKLWKGQRSDSADWEKRHVARRKSLETYIDYIKQGKPLLQSHHLIQEGVKAGPLMGQLLKEGERQAVNHHLKTPEEVVEILKTTSLWKYVGGQS